MSLRYKYCSMSYDADCNICRHIIDIIAHGAKSPVHGILMSSDRLVKNREDAEKLRQVSDWFSARGNIINCYCRQKAQ
jgi:hypothetical protein